MEPSDSSIRRTRSGCWNCKRRRRRCDENKPSCGACQKRGWACHYGIRLLWEHEAESMGIAFGRANTKTRDWSKKQKKKRAHFLFPLRPQAFRYWLNTTSDEIRWLYGDTDSGRRESLFQTEINSLLPVARLPLRNTISRFSFADCPSLEEVDRFLFHYCAFGRLHNELRRNLVLTILVSHTCTLRRSLVNSENPWRSVVLPLCHQSEGLLGMAVAWAAHVLRNQCGDQDVARYDQIILVHKCRSLHYLRNMVPQFSGDKRISIAKTKSERDSLLLLVMFHCLLEIASGSVKEWTYHMKGALLIIKFYTNRSDNIRGVFSHEVLELVYGFFLERETFLRTGTSTSGEEKHNDYLQWSAEIPAIFPGLSHRGSMKINPCMGLSLELLDIISTISTISQRRQSRKVAPGFAHLQHRLNRLEMLTAEKKDTDIMTLHSKAFQSATWIYLHHTLGSHPHYSSVIQETYLPQLLSTLAYIHELHGPLLAFLPYPMWALFIASCVVMEKDRLRILEWFAVLNCKKPVSNVPSTLAAVEAIWKRRDLESDEASARTRSVGAGEANKPVWVAAIEELGWKMPFT